MPDRKRFGINKKFAEILRTVPYERGFHFYAALGDYTGETATSLDALEKKLRVVPKEWVSFHLQRGDFQRWIKDTIGDNELAKRINLITLTLSADILRRELLEIVKTRIVELKQ
jgi:hypothetical protein